MSVSRETFLAPVVDLHAGDRVDLKQLAKGEGVHFSTVYRWALKGRFGIRLPTLVRGGKRLTTWAAFTWWCEAVTSAADGKTTPARSSRRRERAIAQAEAELAEAVT